jgi:hypothetical protein
MLWLAGNHDSPDVEQTMRGIPGVTVLGSKTQTTDGYDVRAGYVDAFGLTIAGLPDPRVYGGPGPYGADDAKVTDPLERDAVDNALADVVGDPGSTSASSSSAPADGTANASEKTGLFFDMFAAHEPVQADELRKQLPDRIRQTDAGHVHKQNDPGDLQSDGPIDLVEGSTGAGGLNDIVRGATRPPIEFSIESVAPDCQFTRVVRFAIASSTPTAASAAEATTPQAFGDDVTASTIYFTPQDIAGNRSCSADLGISAERPL